jgi:Domain of unknown function (DUF4440)
MTDTELRQLCTRYFDAIERRDVDAVAELYAPDFAFWVNLTGAESSREQNLATLRDGYALLRRRSYDDRRIDTFGTGFLVRYSVNVVQHDGRRNLLESMYSSMRVIRPSLHCATMQAANDARRPSCCTTFTE